MENKWKRRIVDGQVWYEITAHNARVFVRGRRVHGMYRWMVQHPNLVYFGWSSTVRQAMDDAEARAMEIDFKSRAR